MKGVETHTCICECMKYSSIFCPLSRLHYLEIDSLEPLGGNKNRVMSAGLVSRLVDNRCSDIMLLHRVLHQSKINTIGSLTGQSSRNSHIFIYLSLLLIPRQRDHMYGIQKHLYRGVQHEPLGPNVLVPTFFAYISMVKVATDSSPTSHVVCIGK